MSAPFILRPVATTLLTAGLALAGAAAYFLLPVAPLPQVDFPTIFVQAQLPGASPETVATSVATPLERHLGQIADVTEMTSQSSLGSARITLQFGLDRDIDGAARDVQAAINAARADLPASLRSNPTYRKANPASQPVIILTLTSTTLSQGQLYDSAATVLQQKLSQLPGVGQVILGGSSLPAVRVEINPHALFKYGIGLEDVRAALAAANANSPKGAIEVGGRRYQVYTNDQATKADQYRDLVVGHRNGSAVRLRDLAEVDDSVEDLRNQGLANGKASVLVLISRQPAANIIELVDRVRALLPELRASIPPDIDLEVAADQTASIRASLADVQRALLIATALVVLVVFAFLRSPRATWIPAVAVPVSLLGTFGAMYLLGYSLDNLSLMALTISTGFVVDDAVVVLENVTRHMEAGMPRRQAALRGAREVSFTVLSMSLSLIAVFTPILLMGGIFGRLFREFAMTISIAIGVSMVVSLTTTPMMCALLLRFGPERRHGLIYRWSEAAFDGMLAAYRVTLGWALRHTRITALSLVATVVFAIFLFGALPKSFLPQQDNGTLFGGIQADQSISFQSMRQKLVQFIGLIEADPAVAGVVAFTGGGATNSGFVYVTLKPLAQRHRLTSDQVIQRLRPQLAKVAGATLFLQAAQGFRAGGRQSNAQYQYTLQSDDLQELRTWGPKLVQALQQVPDVVDVNSDQQDHGLETDLVIDRATAARLGLKASQIDNTLYDAFGQRQVSTIYAALNQYHVVMEVAPEYRENPEALREIYVSTAGGAVSGTQATNAVAGTTAAAAGRTPATTQAATAAAVAADTARNRATNQIATVGHGSASTGSAVSTTPETMVPLSAFVHFGPGTAPLSVSHQGQFVATTLSFNVPPGKSLSDAVNAIDGTMNRIGVPADIHGAFAGNAQVFQQSLANQPILIGSALLAIYIVLGILYESYIHPITILSTLPSAGAGAAIALLVTGTELSIIAVLGVILLIGIVKKNAIMMIDFALAAERARGLAPRQAIFEACLLRFRPIMMTTLAALLGALPLAIGLGEGAELRRPLGISIVGGLIVSQILTLYTTPVVYLYLDRLRIRGGRARRAPRLLPEGGA